MTTPPHEESSMKVSMEIELQPFTVPNYVLTAPKIGRREDGFVELPKYRLEDLDSRTLDRLCNEFRDAVFMKARKEQPPRAA